MGILYSYLGTPFGPKSLESKEDSQGGSDFVSNNQNFRTPAARFKYTFIIKGFPW